MLMSDWKRHKSNKYFLCLNSLVSDSQEAHGDQQPAEGTAKRISSVFLATNKGELRGEKIGLVCEHKQHLSNRNTHGINT